jgi:hypothetical protein
MKPEILYYNTHLVSDILKDNPARLASFFSENSSKDLFDLYEKFGLNKHNMIYDRSGALSHYLNISKKHSMPKNVGCNLTFDEIAEARAKELLSLGKPIYVLWSGGIDSTYILLLLKHFANDPDQVRIYGTYNSIIESGDLFDRRLKHEFKYNIDVASDNEFSYKIDDCIYVSGMGGNQLFGPTDDFFSTTPNALFHHTLGTPDTIYESYEKNINPNLLEFLDPIIKASPRKLETVNDLRWYCIFNLDWYTALYEHRTLIRTPEKAKSIFAFFDTENFQLWAMNTKDPFTKIKGDPNTHRWQMRQTIAELGEPDFAKNKSKKISNFNVNRPQWVFLLDDFTNILED